MNEPLHYAILAGRLILGLVVGFAVWTGDAAFGQESTPAERDAAVIVENFDFPAALRGGARSGMRWRCICHSTF